MDSIVVDKDRTAVAKFSDPSRTVGGDERAYVSYNGTKTLWFNTGTLCNLECVNCYIESSPRNDRLVYLKASDIEPFLDELDAAGENQVEIGFTGGEPFMAPEMGDMLELSLSRGHSVLILTNAMQPMMRKRVQEQILTLKTKHQDRMQFRVSLDHYTAEHHDAERGEGAFAKACLGISWLFENGFHVSIAGRTIWGETDENARHAYGQLIKSLAVDFDPADEKRLVLFPEMREDENTLVALPEITTDCWNILNVSPDDQMCASQRMVVKRKGEAKPSVMACTLIPYDERFDMGNTLRQARQDVPLNHPYCASFCVLGGGSCSA